MEESCLVISGPASASVTLMARERVNIINSVNTLLESISVPVSVP